MYFHVYKKIDFVTSVQHIYFNLAFESQMNKVVTFIILLNLVHEHLNSKGLNILQDFLEVFGGRQWKGFVLKISSKF